MTPEEILWKLSHEINKEKKLNWWLDVRCWWYQLNLSWNKFWFARRFKKNAGSYSLATEARMNDVLSAAKQANTIRQNTIDEFLKERRKYDIQIDD